jgi:hypothetical protein
VRSRRYLGQVGGSSDLAAGRFPLVYSAFPREKEEYTIPMAEAPTGTVTFLLTGVEGCAVLWERNAAAVGVALARHEEILKQVPEAHSDHVFKTGGKASCCASAAATEVSEATLFQEQAEESREMSRRKVLIATTAEDK